MSIQEFMENPYIGYLFMFGPITLYISIIAYSIYKDIDESRKYVTFKIIKGSWGAFWGPTLVCGVLTAIAPIGWFAIIVVAWHIYKDGPLRPGTYVNLAEEIEKKDERMERLENTCSSYQEECMRLRDRCARLEDNVRSYRWHVECLSENRGSNADQRVSSQVNHKRLIMQIEKEIECIKRID